jgi:hypothetical protein
MPVTCVVEVKIRALPFREITDPSILRVLSSIPFKGTENGGAMPPFSFASNQEAWWGLVYNEAQS